MPEVAWIDDSGVVALADAKIPVTDRGFLYGDSIYETLRAYQGKPFAWQVHVERLRASAAGVHLPIRWSDDELRAVVDTLIEASRAGETEQDTALRIVMTRGDGRFGLDPTLSSIARRVFIARPYGGLDASAYLEGVGITLLDGTRAAGRGVGPNLKTGNYLASVLAVAEARASGHHEAVFVDNDRVSEGASSNIFLVVDGRILTPAVDVGILPGITRATVIEIASAKGFSVVETTISRAQVMRAHEAFLCSTLREIVPIVRVDQGIIGDGKPGPMTTQLMRWYRALTRASPDDPPR